MRVSKNRELLARGQKPSQESKNKLKDVNPYYSPVTQEEVKFSGRDIGLTDN